MWSGGRVVRAVLSAGSGSALVLQRGLRQERKTVFWWLLCVWLLASRDSGFAVMCWMESKMLRKCLAM
jgi:hypothetical protein